MDTDPVREHWTREAAGTAGPWEALTVEPPGVTHHRVDADGVPALWLHPSGADADGVLFYIHGGGFVSGGLDTHRKLVGHLARAAGTRALLTTYAHAPDHVHPTQLDQVTRSYLWLRHQGPVAVAGDSCGGWLALSLAIRLRDRGLAPPVALALVSPWVDLTQSGNTYRTNAATDPFFHKPVVDGLAATFLGPASPTDPAVDLLQADLTGLPPLAIQAGGAETLLDDSRTLHARARAAGVESRLEVFPGQQHTFQMAAGRTDVADRAVASLGDWLTSQVEPCSRGR